MKNFKANVPADVQAKLKELAEMVQSEFRSIRSNHGESQSGESRLDEIEGNYVSGWMPRQDGGYSVSEWMISDIDSSYHFTEKQTEYVNSQSEQCYVAFFEDNGIDPTTWDNSTEEHLEAFSEYENDWFSDGALLQVQMFVEGYSENGDEKQITIRASINYKDGEYAREKYAEDIKSVVLEIDEFMKTSNEDIIKQLTF
jgi:hypothetical protein